MPSANSPFLAALALAVVALSGCASEPVAVRADGGAPVCTRTYPTGSNLPVTTCMSAEDAANQKRQFDRSSLPNPGQGKAGGGGG